MIALLWLSLFPLLVRHGKSQHVLTIAGTGAFSPIINGDGSTSTFKEPSGIAVRGDGSAFYVSDLQNNLIRLVVPDASSVGSTVSTFAGSGTPALVDGVGTLASFWSPCGLALDPSGSALYVADSSSNAIRRVATANANVTTLAGGNVIASWSDGTGSSAFFNGPRGIAVDSQGVIYVCDTVNHRIRRLVVSPTSSPTTGYVAIVTTIAGQSNPGNSDGLGTIARFSGPQGLLVSRDDALLLIADTGNNMIRRLFLGNASVKLVAGGAVPGHFDGIGTAATFYSPTDIAPLYTYDGSGGGGVSIAYIITDSYNNYLRLMTPDWNVVKLAGDPAVSGNFADGPFTSAYFSRPYASRAVGCSLPTCAPNPLLGSGLIVGDASNFRLRLVVMCPAGYFCPPGEGKPKLCPGGSYCPALSETPLACTQAGYYCAEGSAAQMPCPAGSYCKAGTALPVLCPPGTYGSVQQLSVDTCSGICRQGWYCAAGSTVSNATRCPPGGYCPTGSGAPVPCGAGTSCYQEGLSIPQVCLPGSYCPAALTVPPLECPAGYFCTSGSGSPTVCPSGAYCASNSSTWKPCSSDANCPAGSAVPNVLPPCDAGNLGFCGTSTILGSIFGTAIIMWIIFLVITYREVGKAYVRVHYPIVYRRLFLCAFKEDEDAVAPENMDTSRRIRITGMVKIAEGNPIAAATAASQRVVQPTKKQIAHHPELKMEEIELPTHPGGGKDKFTPGLEVFQDGGGGAPSSLDTSGGNSSRSPISQQQQQQQVGIAMESTEGSTAALNSGEQIMESPLLIAQRQAAAQRESAPPVAVRSPQQRVAIIFNDAEEETGLRASQRAVVASSRHVASSEIRVRSQGKPGSDVFSVGIAKD